MRRRVLLTAVCCLVTLCSCGEQADRPESSSTDEAADSGSLTVTGEMELDYAEMFTVEHCEGGYELIHIGEDSFLLVPEGADIPRGAEEYTVIHQPAERIYLAASSAMDMFSGLGELEKVRLTSTQRSDWAVPEVCDAIDSGELLYCGKYSAPDYELVTAEDIDIAIESTMIYHSPEAKEKLESLGVPVLVERSSYESHPLGRLEWIKLYGLLIGQEEKAERYFKEKEQIFDSIGEVEIPESERKTAVFFYVSPNGYVNIRKPGDYISKMIELAGGRYIFTADMLDVEENALSTMNIQLETFYEYAKDADVLIYNSTIEGELESLEQFLEKSPVFADMKAVKEGSVWCSGQNMFQQTTCAAEMMQDLNSIFTGAADGKDELTYLHRLR